MWIMQSLISFMIAPLCQVLCAARCCLGSAVSAGQGGRVSIHTFQPRAQHEPGVPKTLAPRCATILSLPSGGLARRSLRSRTQNSGPAGKDGTGAPWRQWCLSGNAHAHSLSRPHGEPPPPSAPSMRGDSRRPCVGLGDHVRPGPGPAGKGALFRACSRRSGAFLGLLSECAEAL